MRCRERTRWLAVNLVAAGALLVLRPNQGIAGTTGKITGEVMDAQNRPIIAATVAVTGTPFGAFTNDKGQYVVLNVPAGTYELHISRVGFRPLTVRDVVVSADQTTRIDGALEETTLTMETVVVSAKRPVVNVNLTSSMATLQSEEIAKLPVQELQDVVNLQAGVVNGHFRGGRLGEVQYQVDGVSINNAFDNSASLRVDRSLLQEVQVISGTFDAEYGQAMSGVVNAVLKNGTAKPQAELELFGGGYVFPGRENDRLVDDGFQPGAIGNATLTMSGPMGLPQTTFLVNMRRYQLDEYVQARREFVPAPTKVPCPDDTTADCSVPTVGDGADLPLGYTREWSGALKITNGSLGNLELSYQALVNDLESRGLNYAFVVNPDGLSTQHTFSIAHGLDATRTFGKSSYVDLSLRQNYFDYFDRAYEDIFDPRYDAAGPPDNHNTLYIMSGVDFTRFQQTTNTYLFKGTLVSQMTPLQQLKAGLEAQWPEVRFGNPGYLVEVQDAASTEPIIARHTVPTPDRPGVQTYWPILGAAFLQDQLEWPHLTLRLGARLDYFDARSSLPSDLANPANAITGAPPSVPVPTTPKAFLSPRLGVAYPITDAAGLHFAYGHFVQYPTLRDVFTNADYAVLANLQASDPNLFGRVMGNPDIEPEKSVQYEFGYKQALSEDFGFELSMFYKDIRDLLGSELIYTYNDAVYARLTNVDFGSTSGITVALDHHRLGPASLALDYTWQRAQGNSSDPYETANRADAGQDPRPRVLPLDWDQRHTLNMTLAFAKPDVYAVSAVLRAASGQPYTPASERSFVAFARNSQRKPAAAVVDLRAERSFRRGRQRWGLYGRVYNLFDARYFNGAVYDDTGSPFYTRFDRPFETSDPTRFYGARRLELGFTLALGS